MLDADLSNEAFPFSTHKLVRATGHLVSTGCALGGSRQRVGVDTGSDVEPARPWASPLALRASVPRVKHMPGGLVHRLSGPPGDSRSQPGFTEPYWCLAHGNPGPKPLPPAQPPTVSPSQRHRAPPPRSRRCSVSSASLEVTGLGTAEQLRCSSRSSCPLG